MVNIDLIRNSIATVPNFPIPGILFRDITTLIADPKAFQEAVKAFVEYYKDKGITKVCGTESRGFLFSAPVAIGLGLPLILVRKPGKLPRETVKLTYQLEYGEDTLELHKDCVQEGDNVLVIDDLLATGGTVSATVNLIRELGGDVKHAGFVIDLVDLPGRKINLNGR